MANIIKNINKISLRSRILNLSVGESIVVNMSDYGYTTIRSYASDLGFAANMRLTAHRNRIDRTYTITRLS